ncbi:hypothetical protein NOCA150181 [metagenome]|uniref:Uncharacterized protein n=1 Tax=metagenome TaxID=256318 RepID=A0A2P2CIY8_9ZZZZ
MAELARVGTESGVEVWADAARSVIEYRASDGPRLRFETFHSRAFLVQERMGARIVASGSRFDRALIDSYYFIPGWGLEHDSDRATDATSVDEYFGRIIGVRDFPERVESICRAQWHGARFSAVVSLGAPRWPVGELPALADGYPDDWPSPDRVDVSPTRLAFHVRGQGAATQTVRLRNWAGRPQAVRVHAPTSVQFTTSTGDKVVPGNGGSYDLRVRFQTHGGRTFTGTVDLDTPRGRVRIGLTGYSEHDNR